MNIQNLSICLWFDNQAQEAANFYTSIFKDSEIYNTAKFSKQGFEQHGMPDGSVMTVSFRINNIKIVAVNGGPIFTFNEAVSIIINCDTQQEIDYYWAHLTQNGIEQQCGWLKDKYGVSWQITPTCLEKYLTSTNAQKKENVEKQLFQMKKIHIQTLEKAYES